MEEASGRCGDPLKLLSLLRQEGWERLLRRVLSRRDTCLCTHPALMR